MVSYYRRMDSLSAITYRGLTLGLSMLPLLFLADFNEFQRILDFLPYILAGSIFSALGNWCSANTYVHLPIGIGSALTMSAASIVAVLIGFLFLSEMLVASQIISIALILVGVFLLGVSKSNGPLPKKFNVPSGLAYASMSGLFAGSAYSIIGTTARSFDPFIAGYMWEFMIGIIAASIACMRGMFGGRPLSPVSRNDFFRILKFCSPTLIGSGLYVYSMSIGPVGIATAIIGTMMVFSSIFASIIYKEKLSIKQWILIAFVCSIVVSLKLFS